MTSLLDETLQRDINHIRNKVVEMGTLAESALNDSLKAIRENNRQLAYYIILRDRYIDEMEKELDRLCQEFLVRQQPAAGNLRFVYAAIKINNELERVGDYAESIARQFLTITDIDPRPSYPKLDNIANLSIPMLHDAIEAFKNKDAELAKLTMELEEKVNELRSEIHDELVKLRGEEKLPLEALSPFMIIASRFERVADQACNICEEVLFMCTGENIKHPGKDVFRVLFVDEGDACRGQMAVGIANSLGLKDFHFSSAGVSPQQVDPKTIEFMKSKGIDISQQASKHLHQILNMEDYEVIVSLCKAAEEAFPPASRTVRVRWKIKNPLKAKGNDKQVQAAYEKAYKFLDENIRDLIKAVLGNQSKQEEKTHA